MDRLDAPASAFRPYLKCLLGAIIVHVVVGAPFGKEVLWDNDVILTIGLQDIPSPLRGFIQGIPNRGFRVKL